MQHHVAVLCSERIELRQVLLGGLVVDPQLAGAGDEAQVYDVTVDLRKVDDADFLGDDRPDLTVRPNGSRPIGRLGELLDRVGEWAERPVGLVLIHDDRSVAQCDEGDRIALDVRRVGRRERVPCASADSPGDPRDRGFGDLPALGFAQRLDELVGTRHSGRRRLQQPEALEAAAYCLPLRLGRLDEREP
jgi:hypothetical protein